MDKHARKLLETHRRLRYRHVGKRLYVEQLMHGRFAVTTGYGRVMRNSNLVRRHLGDKVGRFKERLSELEWMHEVRMGKYN